jgi:5'(3')-deoxyribonucleotidase
MKRHRYTKNVATTPKIALFDLDGTLTDFERAMRRDLKRLASPRESGVQDVHSKKLPSYLKNRINILKNSPGWWEKLPELKLGFDILKAARQVGYEIHILTKGPSTSTGSYSEKARWVKQHIPDARITIADDKGMVWGKVLVDDYPVFIERWLEHRPRGLVVMPQNKSNKHFKNPQVIAYNGRNLKQVKKVLRARLRIPEIAEQ